MYATSAGKPCMMHVIGNQRVMGQTHSHVTQKKEFDNNGLEQNYSVIMRLGVKF